MSEYRIVNEKSHQVQKRYGDNWATIYYCSSKEAAERCLNDCIEESAEWEKLTPDEQRRAILRDKK